MRFWDSSALMPLLVHESSSAAILAELERDADVLVWWATDVECVSALARLERDGLVNDDSVADALRRLDALARGWQEIQPVDQVKRIAARALRVHPLRAADALQLGAAIVAAEGHPETLPFVTLDARLGRAAEREGFAVTRPAAA